jgi:hypothetical protein
MSRAGIFIGVDHVGGGLPRLQDAAAGASRMHEWARSQGMVDGTHAKLLTDTGGRPVKANMVFDAIEAVVDGAGVDQLIVYFAGHGLTINRSAHWLLTDAPEHPNAAINVVGSAELAGSCGIQHVVFISDACRSAPQGIQWQNVRGTDIFPNLPVSDEPNPVDKFFACVLGQKATEVPDPKAVAGYSALYTEILLEALEGKRDEVLEASPAPGDKSYSLVRPDRLQRFLKSEIPRQVRRRGLLRTVNQAPEAQILSQNTWLSRVPRPAPDHAVTPIEPLDADTAVTYTVGHGDSLTRLANQHGTSIAAIMSLNGSQASSAVDLTRPGTVIRIPSLLTQSRTVVSERLITSALTGEAALDEQIEVAAGLPIADEFVQTVSRLTGPPPGPDQVKSGCAIKVVGARIAEFHSRRANGELERSNIDVLRLKWTGQPAAASVLLRFQGGFGTVVPAIPEFLATLTFDGRDLIDVSYEPSANTRRWPAFKRRAADLRAFRAASASASQHGSFRLSDGESNRASQQMAYGMSIDPTLALYAGYTYHDFQQVFRIRKMADTMRGDIGTTLFDLNLLGRRLVNPAVGNRADFVPFVPMMVRGWNLLPAHRVRLHDSLNGIETHLLDSFWSLFDDQGVAKLREALVSGGVR